MYVSNSKIPSKLLLLLSILLISRFKDLWKILQLPVSSPVSQIFQELFSSFSFSFHFRHLSFNGIMKEAISSQNMTDPIGFSTQGVIQKCPLSYTFKLLSLNILSFQFSCSTTFQSSPNTSAPIFVVSRILNHIKQLLQA